MSSYDSIDAIQNDKIKSALIKIQSIKEEYEVTLQRYREAGQNFITNLQTENTSPDSNTFTALKGRSWWGTKPLSQGKVSSQQECENMCAKSNECSGATFNEVERYCWTRSGESKITVGRNHDYALITKQRAALSSLKYLNQRLLELNNEMRDELTKIKPKAKQQYDEKSAKQQELNKSYDILIKQKIKLDEELENYYSTLEEEKNEYIFVKQQHLIYSILFIITAALLLIMIQLLLGIEFSSNILYMYTWILFTLIFIVLTYNLTSPLGFIMWAIYLMLILLYVSGNLPFFTS